MTSDSISLHELKILQMAERLAPLPDEKIRALGVILEIAF
jgi:hypothetical protein